MKYLAVLFMCNDEPRAKFVIDNFCQHNPDIILVVYNGGKPLSDDFRSNLMRYVNIILHEGKNLWHTKTRHPPGSFSFGWFRFLFELHEEYDPDYLIFLETDVKTTKRIEIDPKYDVSGPCINCGVLEQLMMYDFWGNFLAGNPFSELSSSPWSHKFHTGMGGTAFSRKFFKQCRDKLILVELCYETIPLHAYQDVMISCFARYCGCTLGDWEEATDTRGSHRKIGNTEAWRYEPMNEKCALIHNFKV